MKPINAHPRQFRDDVFGVFDNGDGTKVMQFEVSAITIGTTRTVTMPDADVDLTRLTAVAGTAEANKALVVDGSKNIASIGTLGMAGLLTNILSVTDTTGLYIDGATNDYTETTTNYIQRLTRDITSSGTVGLTSYGVSTVINNARVYSGSQSGPVALTTYGSFDDITISGAHSGSIGGGGATLTENNYAKYGKLTRSGTLTSTVAGGTTINNYGSYNEIADSIILNQGGEILNINDYGSYNVVTQSGAETDGTMNKTSYAVYGKVTGAADGTSKAYGGWFSAAGADENYGIWVDAGGITSTTTIKGLKFHTTNAVEPANDDGAAFGSGSDASGAGAFASGLIAIASGTASNATGREVQATDLNDTAIGAFVGATAPNALIVAIAGTYGTALASGNPSVVVGIERAGKGKTNNLSATAQSTVALGMDVSATVANTVISGIGFTNSATGTYQLGYECEGLRFATTETVFNDGGLDLNFRIEGTGEDKLFLVDAGLDVVRMGDGDTNYTQIDSLGNIIQVGTGRTIESEKSKRTAIGGYAIKLTNTTGAVTVKGQTVKADPDTDDAVILTDADDNECLGVFLDAGVADDAEAWVVQGGIADVAMEDDTAATHGNWVETSDSEAGYANAESTTPIAAPQHFNEIGHCIESVAADGEGTHILARCVLHFN